MLFTILTLAMTALAGESAVKKVEWKPDNNNARRIIMEYYTSMNSKGDVDLHFTLKQTSFQNINDGNRNPRICVGFREYRASDPLNDNWDNREFDVAVMSIRRWQDNRWEAKDMFSTNP